MEVPTDVVNAGEEIIQCPSCNMELQYSEVKTHCQKEIEQLEQAQQQGMVNNVKRLLSCTATTDAEVHVNGGSVEQRKPWVVFQRVQRNRLTRLKQRTRKRPAHPPTEYPCPVCNASFAPNEIQQHTEKCLRRSSLNGDTNGRDGNSSNEEEEVAGEEYEEYEWAGQKRIRVSSLLQGGYAAIGVGQTHRNHNGSREQREDEEEEDLNVDEDDTQIYGPPQYDESDVMTFDSDGANEENNVTNYVRRLITGNSESQNSTHSTVPTEGNEPTTTTVSSEAATSTRDIPNAVQPKESLSSEKKVSVLPYRQVIEALKAKLRQYETQVHSKFKCLICLDEYRNPAISVACWHVHCEECWLRSLGARKLCPQCNLITTPKDLRRIYM